MRRHRTESPTFTGAPRMLRRRPGHNGRPPSLPPRIDVLATGTPPAGEQLVPPPPAVGGARLLVTDLRVGFLLLNEARYRTFERLFGLPRDQANLATLVAAVALAEAAHDKVGWLLQARTLAPAELALGGAVFKELVLGPPKPGRPETPGLALLAAFALAGGFVAPALVRSARSVRAATHELRSKLVRRYRRPARPAAG